MAGRMQETPFVGRREELDTVLRRLERAGRGEGGLVLIAGEPGIGKTRLLAEVGARARACGWSVLTGRADEAEGAPPYLAFIEALRRYVRTAPAESLRAQLGDAAPDVALLVREVRSRLPGTVRRRALNPEHERYRLLESVADFLLAVAGAVGQGAGLLLCLEDLHWADTPSLLMLQHLARRSEDAPLLIVGSYRDAEIGPAHPLAGVLLALRRERLAEHLPLGPTTEQETAALIEGLAGRPAAASVAAAVHRATGGNPFFAEEMVHQLRAEGRDITDPEAITSAWEVPQGVRHMIAGRAARRSDPAQRLLQVGAILGDGFDFDLACRLMDTEPASLLGALDEALASGLLREESDRYAFGHALIREALYANLGTARRQHLHRRAAEALERLYAPDLGPQAAALTRHYRLAGPSAARQALAYAQRAAAEAGAVYAWEEAAGHWRTAIDLLAGDEQPARCEALLSLGEAERRAGDQAAARATFDRAAALAARIRSPALLARAALGPGGQPEVGRVDEAEVRRLEQALAALDDEDSALRARLLARLALVLHWAGEPARAAALSSEAIAIARRLDDRPALAHALNDGHLVLGAPEHLDARLALAAEMLAIAEADGDVELALQAYRWQVADLLERGDVAAVDRTIGAHERLAVELRQPLYLWRTAIWRAMRALSDGRFADGEALIERAFALGSRIDPEVARRIAVSQLYAVREDEGRLAELAPELEELAEQFPAIVNWRCALAALHSQVGRETDARAELDRFADADLAAVSRDGAWLLGLALLSYPCISLDDQPRAAALYNLMLPFADRVVLPPWAHYHRGAVSYYLGRLAGLLSRPDAATAHFEDALAMHTRMGARPWVAHTQHDYAAMLLDRRDESGGMRDERNERARELLAQALTTATELRMTRLEEACLQTLQATASGPSSRIPPPSSLRPSFPDGLSAREVEVLGLLAAGLTNREIAARLVLAPGTVHRHLVNIYGKIGARRRVDAAAYALQHGLAATS